MPTIISAKNLTVTYHQKTILDNISFDIPRGKITVILGGSGSGKTTTFKQLVGLEDPTSGEVWINNQCLTTANLKKRKAILSDIGILFQSNALFRSMSVIDNVKLPLEAHTNLPQNAITRIAMTKLKMVGLNGYEHFLPAEISGGMQKRAALARAMALDPAIVFLDEPGSGLDPITASALDDVLLELKNALNMTFVIITHEIASVEKIADLAIVLRDSKIIAQGSPQALQQSSNEYVHHFFNRLAYEDIQ